MTSHTAFFYGTLMAPPVLHRVIWGQPSPPTPAHASLLHIRPAILHAHRRHRVKDADYPAILPSASPAASVRGTLVTGLTDGDMWRLDIFEGDEYKRRGVRVRVLVEQGAGAGAGAGTKEEEGEGGIGDVTLAEEDNVEGEEVEAETYVWVAGETELEDAEWDFGEFVRDKMKWWVGGRAEEADSGFRDVDEAVAKEKDGTRGRGQGGEISKLLESIEKEKEVLGAAV